jgi:hypothetical protein
MQTDFRCEERVGPVCINVLVQRGIQEKQMYG